MSLGEVPLHGAHSQWIHGGAVAVVCTHTVLEDAEVLNGLSTPILKLSSLNMAGASESPWRANHFS